MNFFEHQDRARGTTRKLVLLFALAVGSLIVITTFLVVVLLSLAEQSQGEPGFNADFPGSNVFLAVAALVIAVVSFGTMFRMAQLSGGGRVVAESLGGRQLNSDSRNADERKVLNVVEEMAIAAGLPVPPVYLLDDLAINAFAAGFKPEDAVIGVTRGCIQQLNRDELQGVIAHEFSHIFNGDMRLNIRLMGWLYGILVIGMIGYFIMRGSMYSSGGRGRNNKGGIIALGLGLVVVGYGGTFFGNLIKAAVSRQREFLADASAVQFTRNPEGIAGALKKIGGYSEGSLLTSTNASEVSHMLFGQGIKSGFTGLFATHPPLQERIRRIQPGWNGEVKKPAQTAHKSSSGNSNAGAYSASALASGLVAAVGEPNAASLSEASRHLAEIPAQIQDEAHNPLGACLLIHVLIISGSDNTVQTAQLEFLQNKLSAQSYKLCRSLYARVAELPRDKQLTMVEMAMPSLKQLSEAQAREFLGQLQILVQADKQVTMFEWSIFRLLQQHLHLSGAKVSGYSANTDLEKCGLACEVLFSVLAYSGHTEHQLTQASFKAGTDALGIGSLKLLPQQDIGIAELEKAIASLQSLKPLQKPKLLKAMVACIGYDGLVLAEELGLLRAVGALLDCPVPPLPDTL